MSKDSVEVPPQSPSERKQLWRRWNAYALGFLALLAGGTVDAAHFALIGAPYRVYTLFEAPKFPFVIASPGLVVTLVAWIVLYIKYHESLSEGLLIGGWSA